MRCGWPAWAISTYCEPSNIEARSRTRHPRVQGRTASIALPAAIGASSATATSHLFAGQQPATDACLYPGPDPARGPGNGGIGGGQPLVPIPLMREILDDAAVPRVNR